MAANVETMFPQERNRGTDWEPWWQKLRSLGKL